MLLWLRRVVQIVHTHPSTTFEWLSAFNLHHLKSLVPAWVTVTTVRFTLLTVGLSNTHIDMHIVGTDTVDAVNRGAGAGRVPF